MFGAVLVLLGAISSAPATARDYVGPAEAGEGSPAGPAETLSVAPPGSGAAPAETLSVSPAGSVPAGGTVATPGAGGSGGVSSGVSPAGGSSGSASVVQAARASSAAVPSPTAPPEATGLERVSAGALQKPRPKYWGPFPRPKVTGFGGPVAQGTGLNGAFAFMVGIRGGVTILRRVSIGGTMLWLLNPADAGKTELGQRQRLNMNFGGVLLDVVFARTRTIDFTLEGVFGGGGACRQSAEDGTCFARTSFFFGQPGAAMHIRVSPIVRLMFGLGYRLVAARAWDGPGSRRLGAPVGSFMLELGWF